VYTGCLIIDNQLSMIDNLVENCVKNKTASVITETVEIL
jgi:hypothetical protein